jgi:hypothetical protein
MVSLARFMKRYKSKDTIYNGNMKSKEFEQLAKSIREEKNPKVEYHVTVTTRIPYNGNVEREK